MRIISSRKLRFYTKDRQETFVTEGHNVIQDCPDWAKNDDTFQVALSAGLVQIISSRSVQKQMENKPEEVLPQNAHEAKALIEEPQNDVHMDEEVVVKEAEAPKKKRNRRKKD